MPATATGFRSTRLRRRRLSKPLPQAPFRKTISRPASARGFSPATNERTVLCPKGSDAGTAGRRKLRSLADGLAKGSNLTLSGHCRWCKKSGHFEQRLSPENRRLLREPTKRRGRSKRKNLRPRGCAGSILELMRLVRGSRAAAQTQHLVIRGAAKMI